MSVDWDLKTFYTICDFVLNANPHILFLIKVKCNDHLTNKLKVSLKFQGCFTISSSGLSRCLCLLWKDNIDVHIRSYSHHHIDSSINWNNLDVSLVFMGIQRLIIRLLLTSEII